MERSPFAPAGAGCPLVFALLQWPALAAVLSAPGHGWGTVLKAVLGAWLLAVQTMAFLPRFQGAPRLALGILLNCVLFAGAWVSYPHWECLVWAWLLGLSFFGSLGWAREINRIKAAQANLAAHPRHPAETRREKADSSV